MDVELPPVIAVRRFLREQRARRDAFHGWCDDAYMHQWKHVARSKPSGQVLQTFASGIDEAFEKAGAVDVYRRGTPDRLRLKALTEFKVQGHVLWPSNLGENATGDDPAYTTEAALIIQSKAQVSPSKVMVSEAPLCLGWTRHALERLCERAGGMAELSAVLSASTGEIGGSLAVALMTDLLKPDTVAGMANTVWIPYRKGLLIFTDRHLGANVSCPAVGWRFDYRKGLFSGGNIRSEFLLSNVPLPSSRRFKVVTAAMWFATTFVGAELLSPIQRQYADLFEQLLRILGPAAAAESFAMRFDPGRRLDALKKSPVLANDCSTLVTDLKTIVAGSGFQARARDLGTMILDDDVTTRAFRASLQERSGEPEIASRTP